MNSISRQNSIKISTTTQRNRRKRNRSNKRTMDRHRRRKKDDKNKTSKRKQSTHTANITKTNRDAKQHIKQNRQNIQSKTKSHEK